MSRHKEQIKFGEDRPPLCPEAFVFPPLLSKNIIIKIYRIIIFPPVYYECENSILTLRRKHRLRVFESRAPRKIFRSRREEVRRD
jgi:hypothetical protein